MKKLKLRRVQPAERSASSRYRIGYADELNAAQYEAVMHGSGAALVIAGAGTGKTRTLIYRVARLVEDGVDPKSILLLTFTRKSATEMLRRATLLLDGRCEQVAGGTFHSFAHQTLRRYARHLGFDANFTVLDQSDAEDVVNLLRGQLIDSARRKRFPRKQTLFNIISGSVNRCIDIAELVKDVYPHFIDNSAEIEYLAESYRQYKRRFNLMDYDDLLVHMHSLLREQAAVRDNLHRQYHYLMVDEYQDTNLLQHEIVLALAGKRANVMAVGDDAQSIYSFRGANFKNILTFPQSFDRCAIIKLEENYRSSQTILDLTNEIIKRAEHSFDKELYSRMASEELPALVRADTERQQSQFVVSQILQLREEGMALSDIAVLFRSGFHSFDLEVELQRANIPHKKFGGFKFIETAHIKDIIAHLRVLANPKDAVSWNRILLLLNGIGPKKAQTVIDAIAEGSVSLRQKDDLNSLVQGSSAAQLLFSTLRQASRGDSKVDDVVNQIVEYYRPILRKKYDDYNKRSRDIEVFQTIAERYRSMHSLLSDMALEAPVESVDDIERPGTEEEFLTLSTIHSAKGLEWNAVFIIWALDGRFPPVRSFQSNDDLEEERRLFYVACTRAAEHLFISYPINIFDRETGMVLGSPSRFIEGIDEEFFDEFLIEFEEE